MSKKTILASTILASIALALLLIAASTYAQKTPQLTLQLKYYNGTVLIPLADQTVTIKINESIYPNVMTNASGHVILTDDVPYMNVNIQVWWNASWGVSYLVNETSGVNLTNGTVINCRIYYVNYKPIDSQSNILPYAIVEIVDLNASKTAYEINVREEGIAKKIMLPADLRGTRYFRWTVYWLPTTPFEKSPLTKVYNVTGNVTQFAINHSNATLEYGFAEMRCSVYYVNVSKAIWPEDKNITKMPLSSSGDLLIYACIYYNGTLRSTQARISDGTFMNMRVAAIAKDDSTTGEGNLTGYEFRIYWRWEKPSIEYLVYYNIDEFGPINESKTIDSKKHNITAHCVLTSIQLLDKSGQPLALTDVKITFPIYNYEFTTTTVTGPNTTDGCVDWSEISGSGIYYPPDVIPLPIKHRDINLTFSIKAVYEGVEVLSETFEPKDWRSWPREGTLGNPMLKLTCNVYWVSFNLIDAHDRLLNGNAKLTVSYPDAGVDISFMIVNGTGGRRLPGGYNLTATLYYKDVSGLPTIEPTTFNISGESTYITLKFPIYDLTVYVYDWYGEKIIEKLYGNISFRGELWPPQLAEFNETIKGHVFKQLPRGGVYEVQMYTDPNGGTPGFNASAACGKPVGSITVEMPDSDLAVNITIPMYNPRFIIKAADGSDIPTAFLNDTWIVVYANTSTLSPDETILLNRTTDITYESDQYKGICFVGGWAYPVRVYIAGVVVYDEEIVLPHPSENTTITLYVNLYKSKARVTTFNGEYPIPHLMFRLGWVGINVTNFSKQELLSSNWSNYYDDFKNVITVNGEVIAYNESKAFTNENGEVEFWIPVWSLDNWNVTTVVYGVYTVPGETPGVPGSAPSKLVTHYEGERIGIKGELMNVSAGLDLGNITTYAYDFSVKLLNYLDKPIANYVVFVNGTFVAGEFSSDKIMNKTTDVDGIAVFESGADGVFYFGNYSYKVCAFQDVSVPYPQMVCNSSILTAGNWSHEETVTLKFPGALIVTALDWEGNPLVGARVELYWANGSWTGGLTAYAITNNEGTATIYMSNTWSYYTVMVWWRGSVVNQMYRLEEQLNYAEYPAVYGYAERMMVYNPKITLVSDTGKALPAGITVEVTWPDEVTETYTTDATGSIMMAQAPIGMYIVKAYWNNIKIYDSELWIESDVPVTLKTTVYEVELNFITPKGTPLAGASVVVVYPDGRSEEITLNSKGKAVLPFVAVDEAHKTLVIESVTWLNTTITLTNNEATIESSGPVTFYAANVYTLTVSVVGSQGQPLDGATVTILKNGVPVATATAKGGVATIELPAGTYTVQASFLGKKGETSVTLTQNAMVEVPLDVFIVIGNQAFSVGEVVLWIVVGIIIVLVLAAIIIVMTRIGRRRVTATETS